MNTMESLLFVISYVLVVQFFTTAILIHKLRKIKIKREGPSLGSEITLEHIYSLHEEESTDFDNAVLMFFDLNCATCEKVIGGTGDLFHTGKIRYIAGGKKEDVRKYETSHKYDVSYLYADKGYILHQLNIHAFPFFLIVKNKRVVFKNIASIENIRTAIADLKL